MRVPNAARSPASVWATRAWSPPSAPPPPPPPIRAASPGGWEGRAGGASADIGLTAAAPPRVGVAGEPERRRKRPDRQNGAGDKRKEDEQHAQDEEDHRRCSRHHPPCSAGGLHQRYRGCRLAFAERPF